MVPVRVWRCVQVTSSKLLVTVLVVVTASGQRTSATPGLSIQFIKHLRQCSMPQQGVCTASTTRSRHIAHSKSGSLQSASRARFMKRLQKRYTVRSSLEFLLAGRAAFKCTLSPFKDFLRTIYCLRVVVLVCGSFLKVRVV